MTFPQAIARELERQRLFRPKPFASTHEGLALLQEKLEALKTGVFGVMPPETLMSDLLELGARVQRFGEDLLFARLAENARARAERSGQ